MIKQVRYAAHTIPNAKSARARGSYLRVSFKNTRETAQAINGWKLQRALVYLENVINHKEAVPMRRYAGSTGRTAQGEFTLFFRTDDRNSVQKMKRRSRRFTWNEGSTELLYC